ncbi:MAG: DNA internalization-related competence protein ComEC/Rec2 [Polyangiaceae bacterium]|nr:DNA internalization-related competence protein ComEC/Rec2 [Polyangiaceae bacterium]
MIDVWVIVAGAALGGAALAASPSAALAAAIGSLWILWKRRAAHPAIVAGCAALLSLQTMRAYTLLGEARDAYTKSTEEFTPPGVCVFKGAVVDSPIASVRGDNVYTRASVHIESGDCEGRVLTAGSVARVYQLPEDLRRGDRIEAVAKLAPVHLFEHEELPNAWVPVARSRVAASGAAIDVVIAERAFSPGGLVDAARAAVRKRILKTYTPEAAGLGRALVLGETDLDEDDLAAFRDSGLLHLLAVSGTHLVIVVAALSGALRRALVRVTALSARWEVGRIAAAFGIGAAWLYADFAGGSGSAVRAAAMLTVALSAKVWGRRPTPGRALAVGLCGAAMLDPLVLLDVSFALSTGATAGLVILGEPISKGLTRCVHKLMRRVPDADEAVETRFDRGLKYVLGSVGTTLAATLGSAPAMLRLSPRMPVLGLVANVIAAPIGELMALPVCLAHAALGWIGPLEQALAWVGSGALMFVNGVAHAASGVGGTLPVRSPSPWQLAVLLCGGVGWKVARSRLNRVSALMGTAAMVLAFEWVHMEHGSPKGVLRVTMLDVGQGDSILIDFPDGKSMLVDGGGMVGNPVDPGSRVILPVLSARRRDGVDVMVLTHPHPDHFTGLKSVAERAKVGEFWETGQGEAHGARGAYAELLRALRGQGAVIRRPKELCKGVHMFGEATVKVLRPCPDVHMDTPANDASLVLHIRYGRRSVLLVGDSEVDAEKELIAEGVRLRADVLKVGHHGSRTSSSEGMLRAVRPRFSFISCGVRNTFGHPHRAAMERLEQAGTEIFRTDRGGEIIWETDGETMSITRP